MAQRLETKMLKPFTLAAVLALAGSAEAHDYSADMICRVTETDGQRSAWSFAPNTASADGSPISTFVETSYLGHGKVRCEPNRLAPRVAHDCEPSRRRDLAAAE
jgi:hypothetical protein